MGRASRIDSRKRRHLERRKELCELRAAVATLELANYQAHRRAEDLADELRASQARERLLSQRLAEARRGVDLERRDHE
jgi:hypothetical protein